MYTRLSPENSNYKLDLYTEPLDPVDFLWLKTLMVLDCVNVYDIMCRTLSHSEEKNLCEAEKIGAVQIGTLRIRQYLEYFKQTNLVHYNSQIVFYATVVLKDGRQNQVVWPLGSKELFVVTAWGLGLNDIIPYNFEERVFLGEKVENVVDWGKPYVENTSFYRVYVPKSRRFLSRKYKSIEVSHDEIRYRGWYENAPHNLCINQKEIKDPMWLESHQDEVKFLSNVMRDSGIPIVRSSNCYGFIDEYHW